MRKQSRRHVCWRWLMLFGMLFHVLVTHQHDLADWLHAPVADEVLAIEMPHEHDRGHAHFDVDHPQAYLCPSSTEAQDQLGLKLASLLASLPVLLAPPQTPLKLVSLWDIPEPQPPPEQRRLALTTTILLI